MDTSKPNVGVLFSSGTRYQIPPYQREYQWLPERWQSLWHDLGALLIDTEQGRNELRPHFIGAIIVEQETAQPGTPLTNSVIDGQQRLVTLSVLLAAIRDAIAEANGEEVPADHGLFWIRDESGSVAGNRLVVQEVDEDALQRAMEGGWRDWYGQARHNKYLNHTRVLYAYTYFRYCIWKGMQSFEDSQDPYALPLYRASTANLTAEDLWQQTHDASNGTSREPINLAELNNIVRNRLFVLNIILEDSDEDGATIFDTMNAKRTQLEQWDFIRNSVFIRLAQSDRESVFASEWAPAQKELVRWSYPGLRAQSRDAFVYDYLISVGEYGHQGSINRTRGHEQFMKRLNRVSSGNGGVSLPDFVRNDFLPAVDVWGCSVGALNSVDRSGRRRLPQEARTSRDQIMALSSGPPIPVIMNYIDGWRRRAIDDGELSACLRLLESYVARHVLCQTPMSPFRAHFMQMMASLAGDYAIASLAEQLAASWKSDRDVRDSMLDTPMYGVVGAAQLGAIFRGIELQLAGPGAHPLEFGRGGQQYSVEHVYPKSCASAPNAAWAAEFQRWRVSETEQSWIAQHLNHIGNLTVLTNYANKRLQASAFASKKDALQGRNPEIQIPALAVNSDISGAAKWTKHQMLSRTERLLTAALERWPTPDIVADALDGSANDNEH